jgi:hypothetical protein
VRDILWLRWFAVAAALTNIPYFLLQGTVLWPPVLWGSGVHRHQSVSDLAHLSRAPSHRPFSRDEQRSLYELGFQSLRPREFVALTLVGEWKDAAPGDKMS